MKLLRYLEDGEAQIGALVGDGIVRIDGFRTMLGLIESSADIGRLSDQVANGQPARPLAGARLLAPIERPGKYLALGINYRNHLAEIGITSIPEHQMWFNKQTSCIAGPFDPIERGVTEKLDYEVELGLVIGKRAKHVSRSAAPEHVFGYFVANDVSARDWQFHSNTITIGKSFDTHGPIGPWIVTADEVPDPHGLELRCFVNGELRQSDNTRDMISNVWDQIEYLSTAFTLDPGDLLATGTPGGVGLAMKPPVFLQPGDVVRCEVEGIGAIENVVIG